MSVDQRVAIKFIDGAPSTSGNWSDVAPMTGSHIPGVDTGARNGQTTFMGSNGPQTISSGMGSFGRGLASRDHLGTSPSGLRSGDGVTGSGSRQTLQSTIDQFNANAARQFDAGNQALEAQTGQIAMAYVDIRGQALLDREYAGTLSQVYGNLGSVGRFTQGVQYDRNGFAAESGQENNPLLWNGSETVGANKPDASGSVPGLHTPLDQQIRENTKWFGKALEWLAYIKQVPSASSSVDLPTIGAAVSAFKDAAAMDADSSDFASRWQVATQAINTMITVNGWTYAPSGDTAPSGPVTLATITVIPTPDELSQAGLTSKPSFDALVRGQQGRPIDLQLARIAQAVYDPSVTEVGAWRRLDAVDLQRAHIPPAMLEDAKNGFRAGIYTDGNGHYVLSFAGSNDRADARTDVAQGIGLPTNQYREAYALALRAKGAFGTNLVVTGHSLGGGLATLASATTDSPAVTFNAAGVHGFTFRRFGVPLSRERLIAKDGAIRAYSVSGQILGVAQSHRIAVSEALLGPVLGSAALIEGALPSVEGHRIELPVASSQAGDSLLARHGMDHVLRAIQEAHPEWSALHR